MKKSVKTNGHSNGNETVETNNRRIGKILRIRVTSTDPTISRPIEIILRSAKPPEREKINDALNEVIRVAEAVGLERGLMTSRRHEYQPEDNPRIGVRISNNGIHRHNGDSTS